jgi:amidophosphoribosyltransferase
MAGLLGHGDSFVFRDLQGYVPYFYQDDEVVVVASERPVIKLFLMSFEDVHEIDPGKALIIKKNGTVSMQEILTPTVKKACSFERF